MIRNTCEGCTERAPACHDRCEKYQQARTEHIQQQIWLKQKNNNNKPWHRISMCNIKKWGQR